MKNVYKRLDDGGVIILKSILYSHVARVGFFNRKSIQDVPYDLVSNNGSGSQLTAVLGECCLAYLTRYVQKTGRSVHACL